MMPVFSLSSNLSSPKLLKTSVLKLYFSKEALILFQEIVLGVLIFQSKATALLQLLSKNSIFLPFS